ncbi:ribose-5-phosphate isomerase RpiA [Prosthecomicrobium sp. N25]|uniref:ribose-5-phosphate isomerase RpiA n=1 Tax=Prosthecomicrobium sp. N25 TaxID=3129254 RepID=UPI003078145F
MSAALKRRAAEAALAHVEPGMRLGLGTGSTADEFVKLLGAARLDVLGVPTSERTADLARSLGIRLSTLDETPELDLTVDGADEIGPRLALVKGGGGALLREKIVAAASRRMVVIADASKVVDELGAFPLPIEVVPFGLEATRRAIRARAAALGLDGPLDTRRAPGGGLYVTDGGHYIVDASFRRIPDPEALARSLSEIPGVVEHGLFLGLASAAVVARDDGVVTLTP